MIKHVCDICGKDCNPVKMKEKTYIVNESCLYVQVYRAGLSKEDRVEADICSKCSNKIKLGPVGSVQ